jgi:hypothetical protein
VSGYIEAGYIVALGSLGGYALSLVTRERAARSRLPPPEAEPGPVASEGRETTGASS